jgi:hypothetical protein
MATVNKNFRIKHGLVVEGSTATVNGQNILTATGSDQYILDLVGGANLIDSVASGLSVVASELSIDRTVVDTWYDASGAAATAQSNAEDYADGLAVNYDAAGSADDAETAANSYTDTREIAIITAYEAYADQAEADAKSYADIGIGNVNGDLGDHQNATSAHGVTGNIVGTTDTQTISNKTLGSDLAANGYTVSGLSDPSANQDAATKSYVDGLAVNYDANGSAATAEQNAKDYADDLINDASNASDEVWSAYKTATEISVAQTAAEDYADGLAVNYDAAGAAAAAQGAAEDYADGLISTEVTNRNTAISNAVDSLVDGAPALLNTLNELAAAINDDANYTTTITTALGTKAPLASPDLTGVPTAPTAAADTNTTQIATTAFAKAEADAAQGAAEDYADGLAVNYDAAGAAAAAQGAAEDYADGLAGDILDGTSSFTAVNVNSFASQRAAQATLTSISTGSSMMSWAKSDYPTAKAWVKFATATHSQISEVLLTTDSSNNIAITQFAEVGTNGSLGTISASYLSGNIAIEVDTVYANTTVTVVATLIK